MGSAEVYIKGIPAGISWNYAILVYLLGLIAIILVAAFLPTSPSRPPEHSRRWA